jgi:multidrug resistance efflux pump
MPETAQSHAHLSAFRNGRKVLVSVLAVFLILSSIGGFWYWYQTQKYVYTDKASLSAPIINLTPRHMPGILKNVIVRDGDTIMAHQAVARVGDEIIPSEIDGIILKANRDIGAAYQLGQTVVTMIDPLEMRVVARVEEDKGLKDIHVGQKTELLWTRMVRKNSRALSNQSARPAVKRMWFSIFPTSARKRNLKSKSLMTLTGILCSKTACPRKCGSLNNPYA